MGESLFRCTCPTAKISQRGVLINNRNRILTGARRGDSITLPVVTDHTQVAQQPTPIKITKCKPRFE